ncbi:MAG TPA: hypothetical protein GX519_03420 [Thermoanaerobacterales bacterium]|nr:hypothetical protein [Thermoanaerobacterales bacterium]
MTEKEKVNSNKLSSETVSGEEQMRAISGMSEEEIMAMKRETQELMEEIDTESKTRIYTGPWKTFLLGFSVFWVVFQLYFTTIGTMEAITLRALHATFLLVFCFMLYPGHKKQNRKRKMPTIIDLILIATTLYVFFYFVMNYSRIALFQKV